MFHLVLEVLRRHERVQEAEPALAFAKYDLAGGAGYCSESLSKAFHRRYSAVDLGLVPTSRRMQMLGLGDRPNALKNHRCELSFSRVLFLEAEYDLAGNDALLRALEVQIRVQADLRGVFVHMGRDFFAVDHVLGNPFPDAHGGQRVERMGMDLLAAIRHDAHDDLLPSVLTPGAGLGLEQKWTMFRVSLRAWFVWSGSRPRCIW